MSLSTFPIIFTVLARYPSCSIVSGFDYSNFETEPKFPVGVSQPVTVLEEMYERKHATEIMHGWGCVSNDDTRINRQRNGTHSKNDNDVPSPRGGRSLMHKADLLRNPSDGQI